MADPSFDIAILGDSPLAMLLAGLLAAHHGKRVCLVAETASAFRLPRDIDLGFAAITRPESWAMLRRGEQETVALLSEIGAASAIERVDPWFIAETRPSADALHHARHVAATFGRTLQRTGDRRMPEGAVVFGASGVPCLNRPVLGPLLTAWLQRCGVVHIDAERAAVNLKRDGAARVALPGQPDIEAAQAVIADDQALVRWLEAGSRWPFLAFEAATAILTPVAKPLASPLLYYLDRNIVVRQRAGGGIDALVKGLRRDAAAALGGCLTAVLPLSIIGEAQFQRVVVSDGAPFVGAARGLKATVVAGLSPFGAFLAPALARFISGKASDEENGWFTARGPGRGNSRAVVAEFHAGHAPGTAA